MNNVAVDIIDTIDDNHLTKNEYAKASSIRLGWNGADRKDELKIVGSYLKLTLIGLECTDGQYYDLFSGDETRFKVRFYDFENGTTYWQGFLLPDQYSEPYKDSPIDVSFMAVDGLGRLKGKFLPDDFYKEEKSVISILAKCLELTGLGLDFRFSPAIENSQQKDYDKIYIDTSTLKEKDKKQDAHKVLNELLKSMICTVYQADNYWNIEGLNIREQRVYDAKVYNYKGVHIEDATITRNYKNITPVATPSITMQPPLGYLNVAHKRELFNLKEGLSSEENDGWTYNSEYIKTYNSTSSKDITSYIYVSDWYGRDGFFAYSGTDNKVFFTHASASKPEGGQRIDLNYRPYVKVGNKYSLKFEFEIEPFSDDEEVNKSYVENGDWQNPFDFDIAYWAYPQEEYIRIIGNPIASSNVKYFPINFGTGDKQTVTVEFQFIPKYSGDFIFTIRPLKQNIGIDKVYINELSLELIGEQEERLVSGTVLEGWTTKKEVETEYGSDVNGLSKSFRLQKLNDPFATTTIENTVIREFYYKGRNHVSLKLFAANLVDENREGVFRPTSLDPSVLLPVTVLDVIYNYNNSDEHIVITDAPIYTGKVLVDVHDYGRILEDRDYWEQWTDAVYKVEKEDYNQSMYNVISRLLNKELPGALDLQVKNNVKFNDFIGFTYNNNNEFIVTNCELDIDKGFTDVSIIKKHYIQDSKPVVEISGDLFIDSETTYLQAEAYDPDGFIASYFWEDTTFTGSNINAVNAKETLVYLPPGVYYAKFKVTVTDNEGNTASDEVEVYKSADLTATLTEIYSEDLQYREERHFRLDLNPDLPENMSVIVSGVLKLKYHMSYLMKEAIMEASIEQNGAITTQMINNYTYATDAPDVIQVGQNNNLKDKTIYFNLNYIKGDEVIIKLLGSFDDNNNPYPIQMDGSVDITGIDFKDGLGQITGLPLNKSIELSQIV